MTTTAAGGKITGILALTMIGSGVLAVGDPVQVNGDYSVELADGTKPVIGVVSVANKKRVAGAYPIDNAGGDVTVEARGYSVRKMKSGAAITAGTPVGINSSHVLVPAGANIANIGIALKAAGAANVDIDVLIN